MKIIQDAIKKEKTVSDIEYRSGFELETFLYKNHNSLAIH